MDKKEGEKKRKLDKLGDKLEDEKIISDEVKNNGEVTTNKSILSIELANLTPGMRQYRDAKQANPECIIMMRMGDFYELFYEDAITASRELEITLTARGKGEKRAPLAGIPYHALENYLGRLVKKGYKVAIIEQLEDPKQAKGLVKRGLVRIVTPGTVIESSMLNEKENNYLMALSVEKDYFVMAFCDLSTGEFFTTNAQNERNLQNEIVRFSPKECVVPESLRVNKELLELIQVNGCFVSPLEDYYFKTKKAENILLEHFQLSSLEPFGLENKNLHISVSGGLLKYLMQTQKNTLSHIKKVYYKNNQDRMLLDSSTLRNLELLTNIRENNARGSLLEVIDKTTTSMGARLLKKWLKEPLLNIIRIKERLSAVNALHQKIILREELIIILKEVQDIERLIGRVNYGSANTRDLISLNKSLQQVPIIKEKLLDVSQGLLCHINSMDNQEQVTKLIERAINEEAPISLREGGLIKRGYHEELDELWSIKQNSKEHLRSLEEKEMQRTGISNLKIRFTKVFGYFIEVTKRNIHLVPKDYIRKQTTANSERYITEELKIEEEKILGAQEKIVELEYKLFQDICQTISSQTKDIQTAARKIAVLDVICSLAKVAANNNYVMPEFVDKSVIQIKNGRHPVVEKMENRFIANNVNLLSGEMMIITGPNMAGKSTIMRQTALIVLLAQIGSFVPADECVLGVVDRIFTRVGASDDLSAGQSTFMVEMSETAAILHNATENSLIILDEIGRGTSTFDGVSIAWSVAEHLYNKVKAKTMFATHYHVMNKLEEKFSKIKNYNIAVKEVGNEIVFLRKLIQGGTDQSYGVHVAKLAGMPFEVLERAKEIQRILEKDDDMIRKIKAKKLQEQKGLDEFR
jgi:DNA mismatch repair protein MutS